jgi:predicted metal-dependent hydrolase
MNDLKIRRIPFNFDGVEFVWNPEEPAFAIAMNKVSFYAVGFEKYICQAMQDAEQFITDPAVLKEAKDFRAQEGLHSLAHRKHVKALVARWPDLQKALDVCVQMYDELYARRELKYHLAYIGGLESIFTPSFKLLLDNREALFSGGDARVSSLMLWHFCEEIEHRSSGIAVYNHVHGNYIYRVRRFPQFMGHVNKVIGAITQVFRDTFPDLPATWFADKPNADLPKSEKLRSALGIVSAQLPWHNPDHQPVPKYFREWNSRYERGEDMTQIYGVRWEEQLAAAE